MFNYQSISLHSFKNHNYYLPICVCWELTLSIVLFQSGEVNEAMKKRLESMKLLKKLDEEFSLYIFGFEESVKQAMLYKLG